LAEPVSTTSNLGPPWFALRCIGDPAPRVIPRLQELGLETYCPVVREMRPVPRRKLSHAQRSSGIVIMRPRNVPFIAGVVFARGRPAGAVEQVRWRPSHHFKLGDKVDPADIQRRPVTWEDVFEFPGVLGFITNTDAPGAVLAFELDELRGREVDGVIAGRTPARMIFKLGEEVRVSHGPFMSFNGIVEQVPDVAIEDIDADTRLKLTIDIFGRSTPVELAAWQIEKL
jgi:hypothetical protein